MNNIIEPIHNNDLIDEKTVTRAKHQLAENGWVLMRGFDSNLTKFSELLQQFCQQLTFDPAREFADETMQEKTLLVCI